MQQKRNDEQLLQVPSRNYEQCKHTRIYRQSKCGNRMVGEISELAPESFVWMGKCVATEAVGNWLAAENMLVTYSNAAYTSKDVMNAVNTI